MKRSADVVILGGGVIGLTTAYFLAREGVTVLLCERGQTGREASWAGAGILPPSDLSYAQHPFDRLRALSGALFPALSQELTERTGIDNGFARCGGLEFLRHAGQADAQEWHGHGIPTTPLAEREAVALEPALASHLGEAILVPGMAQLRNPHHLQALRVACLRLKNFTLLEDAPALGFDMAGSRVKGVRLANEVLSGGTVLVAAGPWTESLLQPLGCRLRVPPVRGQIVLLNPGAVVFRHILIWGPQYLVPRLDGRVLIGSTEENAGFEKHTTAAAVQDLLALGLRLMPCLAEATVEKSWAGLRPGSPDGLPYIGLVPGVENLYVAAGHFRAGIQLSPGTALLLKERILGQPLSMPLEPFRLDR